MKKRKYSNRFEEDYNFYLSNKDKYNFCGSDIESDFKIQEDNNGKTAKECFHLFDSNGIRDFRCKEKQELLDVLITKASINLHIKMYAESWANYELSKFEILEISNDINAPKWFYEGIEKQMLKFLKAKQDKDVFNLIPLIESNQFKKED